MVELQAHSFGQRYEPLRLESHNSIPGTGVRQRPSLWTSWLADSHWQCCWSPKWLKNEPGTNQYSEIERHLEDLKHTWLHALQKMHTHSRYTAVSLLFPMRPRGHFVWIWIGINYNAWHPILIKTVLKISIKYRCGLENFSRFQGHPKRPFRNPVFLT